MPLALGFALWLAQTVLSGEPTGEKIYRTQYSAEERDPSRPQRVTQHGSDCLRHRPGSLHWNNWFGYHAHVLDKDCARNLFASKPVRVVLLGGSAMENSEAPNHLTHIYFLAFGNDERVALLNLAESGARLANMIARFIHEVAELRPDIVVFLDGVNEFNSVRYGGASGDDFYYTAGVKSRIEFPLRTLVDKSIEKSQLLQLGLVATGLWNSARTPQLHRPRPPAAPYAAIYLRQRAIAQALCDRYATKCVFILQPTAFTTVPANANTASILADHRRYQLHDEALYQEGLRIIATSDEWRTCRNCYDATNLFSQTDDAFLDFVHYTKHGGRKLGKYIYETSIGAGP